MKWLRVLNYGYGFFIFGLMCLLFLPWVIPLAFLPRTLRLKMQRWVRWVAHYGFVFVRWHCHMTGFASMRLMDHSLGQKSPLLVANHLSMFDIVLLFSYFPTLQTLVNAKFLNNPLLWPIIRACGYISLRTDQAGEGYQAFCELRTVIENGGSVVLFPEGTRSSDGRLGPLKKGPFRLAAELQMPITPVFFTSNQPFLNKRAFFPKEPGPVVLNAYIMPALLTSSDEPIQAKHARSTFLEAYEQFIRSEFALAWNKADGWALSSNNVG